MKSAGKFHERLEKIQQGIKLNQIHNEVILTEPQILMNKLCSIATLKNIARGGLR